MNRRTQMLWVFLFAATVTLAGNAFAAAKEQVASQVKEAVQAALMKKILASGTLDLYDKDQNAVRNLQTIKMGDEVSEKDGVYSVPIDYRDIKSGAIVRVEAQAVSTDNGYELKDLVIASVQELNKADAGKEYTDEDIQAYMTDYLKKQGEFTGGKIMLFDEDKGKMRSLELIDLNKEVRRMGIFSNSRAEFRDIDTGELLGVDISVENQEGRLAVQALRIRNVRPPAKKN